MQNLYVNFYEVSNLRLSIQSIQVRERRVYKSITVARLPKLLFQNAANVITGKNEALCGQAACK